MKENEKMQSKIDDRKKDLQERRLALEQDVCSLWNELFPLSPYKQIYDSVTKIFFPQVAKLQEQLHKEKSSRATLEVGLEFFLI